MVTALLDWAYIFFFQRVSKQRSYSLPLRGWSLLNVVLLVSWYFSTQCAPRYTGAAKKIVIFSHKTSSIFFKVLGIKVQFWIKIKGDRSLISKLRWAAPYFLAFLFTSSKNIALAMHASGRACNPILVLHSRVWLITTQSPLISPGCVVLSYKWDRQTVRDQTSNWECFFCCIKKTLPPTTPQSIMNSKLRWESQCSFELK